MNIKFEKDFGPYSLSIFAIFEVDGEIEMLGRFISHAEIGEIWSFVR